MPLIVEEWPITRLVEYARNPRKNDPHVERMAGMIREFGFRIPIVAKSDGTVVDGHLRLKAARHMGLETVPVALADGLSDAQIKAFRLLANKSVAWSEWDNDLLRIEMEELRFEGFDLALTGFDAPEIASFFGDPPAESAPGNRLGNLADRFGVAPFSVLSAREGWWQDRKRAWLALGIRSELGRGELAAIGGSPVTLDRRSNATPGGRMMPAADYLAVAFSG